MNTLRILGGRLPAPGRDRFDIEGPKVWLTPKHTLALAVHELCTNAVKYGALSNDKGRVRIEWTVAGRLKKKLQGICRGC